MINPSNLKPIERLEEIMGLANKHGGAAIISYFLNELANNSEHKRFDDQCYWKDVEDEFKSEWNYGN